MNKYLAPYIRLAMHHTYLKGYYIERHIWDHEIIYIERGKMKLTVNNKVVHVEKDDCIFLPPNVYHKLEWDGEDCRQPHVHFDFYYQEDSPEVSVSMIRKDQMSDKELALFRKNYLKENDIDLPYVFKLREPTIVRTLLYQIIDEYTFKMNSSDIIIQGLMTQLIGAVIRDYHLGQIEKESMYSQELNSLIIFMSENVENNLSLDDLSGVSNLSKWHLIQLFKKHYNVTPMNYLGRLKYDRAIYLLKYSNLSIKEIAYKMNFESPQSFSRWFKNLDGKAPIIHHKKN